MAGSAAREVFGVIELVEKIFDHLSSKEILRLQRISKTCQNAVTTYAKFQEALCFKPVERKELNKIRNQESACDKELFFAMPDRSCVSTSRFLGSISNIHFHVNPLIYALFIERDSVKEITAVMPRLAYKSVRPGARLVGSSCDVVYLTQPPCHEISFHLSHTSDDTLSLLFRCKSSTGVTIGHVARHAQDWRDREYGGFPGTVYVNKLRIVAA